MKFQLMVDDPHFGGCDELFRGSTLWQKNVEEEASYLVVHRKEREEYLGMLQVSL